MMGKNFQKVFNLYKGSIPARLDVSMDEFDKCAKTSNADIKTAGTKGGLVPSFAHGMAQGNTMKAALQDIITEHFNSCLLYTSPSPRDGLLSRMPSSA